MTRGITAWHVRILCDNVFDGGRGYTPNEVGDMTLDQILMLLTDRKYLIGHRSDCISGNAAAELADDDGNIRGRDADGNLIVGKFRGVSKARKLLQEKQEREAANKAKAGPSPRELRLMQKQGRPRRKRRGVR